MVQKASRGQYRSAADEILGLSIVSVCKIMRQNAKKKYMLRRIFWYTRRAYSLSFARRAASVSIIECRRLWKIFQVYDKFKPGQPGSHALIYHGECRRFEMPKS